MIHAHKVRDKSGDATIWITENINDDPDGETAPFTERVVWAVIRYNIRTVGVYVQEHARMFDGCSSRLTNEPAERVPDDHLKKLKRELQLDLCDRESEQTIHFHDFDTEITTGGKNEPVDV